METKEASQAPPDNDKGDARKMWKKCKGCDFKKKSLRLHLGHKKACKELYSQQELDILEGQKAIEVFNSNTSKNAKALWCDGTRYEIVSLFEFTPFNLFSSPDSSAACAFASTRMRTRWDVTLDESTRSERGARSTAAT